MTKTEVTGSLSYRSSQSVRRPEPDDRQARAERAGLTAAQTRDIYYEYDLRGLQTEARFDGGAGDMVRTWYDDFGRPATVLTPKSPASPATSTTSTTATAGASI